MKKEVEDTIPKPLLAIVHFSHQWYIDTDVMERNF